MCLVFDNHWSRGPNPKDVNDEVFFNNPEQVGNPYRTPNPSFYGKLIGEGCIALFCGVNRRLPLCAPTASRSCPLSKTAWRQHASCALTASPSTSTCASSTLPRRCVLTSQPMCALTRVLRSTARRSPTSRRARLRPVSRLPNSVRVPRASVRGIRATLTSPSMPSGSYDAGKALAAGDFNDDGEADLAIGAPFYVGVRGNAQRGAVFVVNSAGISTSAPAVEEIEVTASRSFVGPEQHGRFGTSNKGRVHTTTPSSCRENACLEPCNAGYALAVVDLNRDGVDDLAVGAPTVGMEQFYYDGRVHVFFGSASGLSASPVGWPPSSRADLRRPLPIADLF